VTRLHRKRRVKRLCRPQLRERPRYNCRPHRYGVSPSSNSKFSKLDRPADDGCGSRAAVLTTLAARPLYLR
jgi:hypothetical protein